jgi:hypothetical protein
METSVDKKSLTLDMVMAVLKLSKLQARTVFTGSLNRPFPAADTVLNGAEIYALLLADMLENLAFLQPAQRALILTELTPRDPADCLTCDPDLLVFADGQYCTWTGKSCFTDLQTGEPVMELPSPFMETISYNLSELYRRGVLKAENRAGFHVKNNAGSVAQ